jgi:hypothetical protein
MAAPKKTNNLMEKISLRNKPNLLNNMDKKQLKKLSNEVVKFSKKKK